MKYIFLDFNGTVLDDTDICLELLNDLLRMQGKKEVSLKHYLDIFGFPVKDYYERAGLDFNIISFEKMAEYFIDEYTRRNVVECSIYPDFRDFVKEVKERGFKLVLCSASKQDLLIDQLKSFDILDCFDYVIGLSDYHAKSKLEVAKQFVKDNNINPKDIYFIGDTDHDHLLAQEIGGVSILVTRGHQSLKVLEKCQAILVGSLMESLDYLK